MTKKAELINYIDAVPDDFSIGVYYLDKMLNILHYNIYKKSESENLLEKVEKFDNNLEDDFIRVESWRSSPSLDYLVGIYDGLLIEMEKKR